MQHPAHLHAVWHVHVDDRADALEVNAPHNPKLRIALGTLPLPRLLLLLLLATLLPPPLGACLLLASRRCSTLPVIVQASCLLGALCRVVRGNKVIKDALVELLHSTQEQQQVLTSHSAPACPEVL